MRAEVCVRKGGHSPVTQMRERERESGLGVAVIFVDRYSFIH